MSLGTRYQSWGGYPRRAQTALAPRFTDEAASALSRLPADSLPFGNGRSYGDSCLAQGGTLLDLRGLDRILAFDPASGRIVCEAGVLLDEIIARVLPSGWFLPVTPGTRFVTVGGAMANDVHGKNHHRAGSFGHHVLGFDLARSDGSLRHCSPVSHPDWFAATLGGLGLTGAILRAELQLRRVNGPWLVSESIRFGRLAEFFALSAESAQDWEYTVAWIDCLARGPALGRGHFMRANHAGPLLQGGWPSGRARSMPFTPPVSLVNSLSLRAFNTLYYHRQQQPVRRGVVHYQPFFYPLDSIGHWNRMYGPRGFQQYQCVLPPAVAADGVAALLEQIARAGQGSFLAVLKVFGEQPGRGWLSFPRPGATLALDFPQQGERTAKLFAALDRIVADAGGTLYPAKDAHMPSALFRAGYPDWLRLESYRDPHLKSALWARLAGEHR